MNQMSRVLRISWGTLCLGLSLLYAYLLVVFYGNPSDYPIGTDAPWWHYKSANAYTLFLILHILWYVLGVLVGFCRSSIHTKLAIIHVLITILWFIFTLSTYSYTEW